MVLVEGFFFLIATQALLSILFGELLLLKLQVSHLVLDSSLTQLLLQLGDHLLESVLLTLSALKDSYVGLEPLVDLLSRRQICSDLLHLLHLLFIYLNCGLMSFQHYYLFFGFLELLSEAFEALFMLKVDVLKLRLQLF